MSRADRHPSEDLLSDLVAGQLDLALRVVLQAHLAGCPACSAVTSELSSSGGHWLAATPAERPRSTSWARLAARLDEPDPTAGYPLPTGVSAELSVGRRASALRWRAIPFAGSRVAVLDQRPGQPLLVMVESRPGRRFPNHLHVGGEVATVLQGGYVDQVGDFEAGDFVVYPAGSSHGPRVDSPEACVVLARVEGGVRFRGPLGWLVRLGQLLTRA